jgi:hypothetical protein
MDTHGYVYAFAHQPNGWIKVGMTEKNDPERCWGRIRHYIKQHRLPDDGWDLVSFIATHKAREVETKLHKSLKKFRVMLEGERTELFHCSLAVYLAALNELDEFIEQSQSTQERAPRETEEQRIEREARELRREQARLRRQIDDEWLLRGHELSKHNKWNREQEFRQRWEQHPIQKARRAKEEVERAERQRREEAERAERQRREAEQQRREALERAQREAALAEQQRRERERRLEQAARWEREQAAKREARWRNSLWFKLRSMLGLTPARSTESVSTAEDGAEKGRLEESAKRTLEAGAEEERLEESAKRTLEAAAEKERLEESAKRTLEAAAEKERLEESARRTLEAAAEKGRLEESARRTLEAASGSSEATVWSGGAP